MLKTIAALGAVFLCLSCSTVADLNPFGDPEINEVGVSERDVRVWQGASEWAGVVEAVAVLAETPGVSPTAIRRFAQVEARVTPLVQARLLLAQATYGGPVVIAAEAEEPNDIVGAIDVGLSFLPVGVSYVAYKQQAAFDASAFLAGEKPFGGQVLTEADARLRQASLRLQDAAAKL